MEACAESAEAIGCGDFELGCGAVGIYPSERYGVVEVAHRVDGYCNADYERADTAAYHMGVHELFRAVGGYDTEGTADTQREGEDVENKAFRGKAAE